MGEMTDEKINAYLAKHPPEKPGYLSDPAYVENQAFKAREDLIAEKGFHQGQEVSLRLLNMKGEITGFTQEHWITVKREDGQEFSYIPEEVDPIA